jgi:hypothetical protein
MAWAMKRLLACLIPALLLSACAATPGEYPSLARRPAERVSGLAVPVPPAPAASPAPLDPAVAGRLDSLLARVRAADAKFWEREKQVRPKIAAASGSAKASEAWSVAMIALADLDAARSEAMVALADIDAIYAAARIEGEAATEAKAARDAAAMRVERQDSVIAELQGKLAP